MAERRPPGFTVDLAFYDSPEAMSIPRKIRAEAIGVWTLAGSYSANQLTDGHVPAEILRSLGCRPAIRAALMATRNADGTPSPLWIEGESGGILFTRWSKWQRTSDEVRNYRLSESERKKRQRAAIKQAVSSDDEKTSAKRPPGRPHNVRAEDRDPKTETETETETNNPTHLPAQAHQRSTEDGRGSALARFRGTNLTARSAGAYRIAEAFSASLSVPIETGLLAEIGVQIDKCLNADIPPPAIAEGLKAWTASDSWSPTQIPRFVHKANNRSTTGKPTAKAKGYDQALAELLQEVQTL